MTIDYRIRNIVIAASLAAAAVLLTVIYVTSARNDTASGKESVTVYVPSKDFAVGTPGSKVAGALDKQTIARKNAAPEAISNLSQLKGLYVTQPVYKGEQLTLNRFALPKEQGIRPQLSGNQRAVQLPGTADQLLSGTLIVGDRVDVVASLKDPKDNSNQTSSVVLRNLRVLQTQDGDGGSKLETADNGAGGHAVILAVTDKQAQRLDYTQKYADHWTLSLRPLKKPKDSNRSVDTYATVLAGGPR
jgi:Flp pilus assembly protein CpaB